MAYLWHSFFDGIISGGSLMPTIGITLMAVLLINLMMAIRTAISSRTMSIDLEQLLRVRDISVKGSLLSRLSDDRRPEMTRLIDAAFSEGDSIWVKEHLPTIIGRKQADHVLKEQFVGQAQGTEE
jgi:hypothetical protein